MLAGWHRLLNGPQYPIDASWIGETPLVASRLLIELIDGKLRNLLDFLSPRLARRKDPSWPLAPAADVISVDLAIVRAPETERGWELRWVEMQTFTSLVSMIYTLHRAATDIWPELGALAFWGTLPGNTGWLEATRQWMAPELNSILLENAPWRQPTRHDFEAARHWFGVTVTAPQSLRARSGQLECRDESDRWHPVPHVANRLILHETPARAEVEELLSSVSPGWNSHPAWYYRINKGVMPDLPLPPAERCARADCWRDLGVPAEGLVAKLCQSYAGRGVKLSVNASELDELDSPQSWIVQPRFSPLELLKARDGAPLYGEIRCVIALPGNGSAPWTVCRLARMTRGPLASAANWSGAPGEGAVPVYAPPASN
jgi:hypothetical protein